MANALYDKYRQADLSWSDAGLSAAIDVATDTIKVALVSASYTANMSTDQFFSSVSAAVVGTPVALTSKTDTAGVLDAGDETFSSVTGSVATQIVIYKDTGTGSTSPLMARIDTATGLPATPNGGNITITWDNGSSKIFKL